MKKPVDKKCYEIRLAIATSAPHHQYVIDHQKQRMKRIIIVFLLKLVLVSSLISQNGANLFGIQSGINYNMTYSNKSINANHKFQTGWIIGLNYEKYVSDNWSLNFEFNRTENKSTIENYSTFRYNSQVGITSTTIGNVEFNEKNNQVMIGVKRYFTKSKNVFIELGWDIKFIHENIGKWDYQLTTIYDQSNFLNPILLDEPEIRTVNSTYSRNGGYIGINVGMGYKHKLSKNIWLLYKGRFSNQLKEAAESGGIILRNVEVLIGIQYTISHKSEERDDL